jgi:long-chain acyl-CoA synthetase
MTKRKNKYPWEKNYPKDISWNLDIEAKPLFNILDDAANANPDNFCIDYFGKKYSYNEIARLSDRFATGLQKIGVNKGDSVGLLMPNCPLFVIAYYAILKIGAVVVNYNPLYTAHELVRQAKDSNTTVMVTLNLRILHEKAANLLQTACVEKVIFGDFRDYLPFPKNKLFSWFKSQELVNIEFGHVNVSAEKMMDNNGFYIPAVIDPDNDVAVYQYTGGTTGEPKSAMLTHKNLYTNTVQVGMWFEGLEDGNEIILGVLPLFHVFAMTVVMNLSILKACQMVLHPRLEMKAILKDIKKKKITLIPGVPSLFTAINNHENLDKYNLSSLKFCISGGAPLPMAVKNKFEELSGCKLIEGYGLSESSPVVVANPLFGENKEGSIGIPLPGTVVEVLGIGEKNSVMKTGQIGEICITGPQVMKGYLNNIAETDEVLQSGRLHTGDMGYMDKDGYFYIVDRLKEMIITNGFNVYPREVEEEIYKHTSVEEVCVVGIDDEHSGQAVKAFIKVKLGENLSIEQIASFLKGKLTKYKIPSQIEFIDEMPKTLIGKISKRALLKNK